MPERGRTGLLLPISTESIQIVKPGTNNQLKFPGFLQVDSRIELKRPKWVAGRHFEPH